MDPSNVIIATIQLVLAFAVFCNIILLLIFHTPIVERVLILVVVCMVSLSTSAYTLIVSLDRTLPLTPSLVLLVPSWLVTLIVSFIFQRRIALTLRNAAPQDDVQWNTETVGWMWIWTAFLLTCGWHLITFLSVAHDVDHPFASIQDDVILPMSQGLMALSLASTTLFTWLPILQAKPGGIANFPPRLFYQHIMLTFTTLLFLLSLVPYWIWRDNTRAFFTHRVQDRDTVWLWPFFILVAVLPELWVLFACSTRVGWWSLCTRGWLEWLGDRMGVVLAEWDDDEDAPTAPPLRLDRTHEDMQRMVHDKGTLRLVEGRAMEPPPAALIRMPPRKPRRKSTLGDWSTLLRIT